MYCKMFSSITASTSIGSTPPYYNPTTKNVADTTNVPAWQEEDKLAPSWDHCCREILLSLKSSIKVIAVPSFKGLEKAQVVETDVI